MNPIQIDPRIMGGCRASPAHVPVKNLFDYLSAGRSLDDFLEGFPTVTREQDITVLEMTKDRVTRTPAPAA